MTSAALRCVASFAVAVAGLAMTGGSAAADPQSLSGSAQSVIDELKDQGYNVVINWNTGYDTKSLSVCWVTDINNPDSSPPPPGTFTTVYVDVSCPNHDYD